MAVRVSQNHTRTYGSQEADQLEKRLPAFKAQKLTGISQGDRIVATCGVLWITQEGDLQDHLLNKGDHFVAAGKGTVVVEAFTDAAYRISKN